MIYRVPIHPLSPELENISLGTVWDSWEIFRSYFLIHPSFRHCTDTIYTALYVLYVKVEGEEAGGSGENGDVGGDAVVGREVSIT